MIGSNLLQVTLSKSFIISPKSTLSKSFTISPKSKKKKTHYTSLSKIIQCGTHENECTHKQ